MKETAMVLERALPHLKDLTKLAADLNEASDRYTEELKAIEAELGKMNIGLEVEIASPIYSEGSLHTYLGYGKAAEGWCLLLSHCRVGKNERDDFKLVDQTPLLKASRDLRIASAGYINDLLKAIGEEAKRKTETLRKVIDSR